MDAMNVKSVSDYIERRYNSLVAYMDRGPADGASMVETVSTQCFVVVDYYNMATHDAHFGEVYAMWEMWTAKFNALYGR